MKDLPVRNLVTLLFIVLLAACTAKPAPDDETATEDPTTNQITLTEGQLKATKLQIGEAQLTTVNEEVKATGTVDVPPQYMASVGVSISGIVKSVGVLPGQKVGKGQTLATIESLDFIQLQQNYLQAASQLTYQEQELARQRDLHANNVSPGRDLQRAEADYTGNRALVQSLALKLQTLGLNAAALEKSGKLVAVVRVVSPISGYITTTHVHLGQHILPTDVLFGVINREHLHLELNVYETDAFKLRIGQIILVNDPKIGPETMRGKVYLVGKALEGDARTITIHGHVEDERLEQRLMPGMFLNARILTGSRQATTLPEEAVIRKGTTGFIYIPTSAHTFQRVAVTLGQVTAGRIAITPLQPVNIHRVVIKGAYLLEAELMKGEDEEVE